MCSLFQLSVAMNRSASALEAWASCPVRCAPPGNAATPTERDTCRPFLERELALLTEVRILLVLYPFITLFAVVVTANHYWLDGVAGVAGLGLGYVLTVWLGNIRDRRRPPRPASRTPASRAARPARARRAPR